MEILRLLSLRNQFVFYQDHVQRVETIRLAETEQVNIVLSYAYNEIYKNDTKIMKSPSCFNWGTASEKNVTNFLLITASPKKYYIIYDTFMV